MNNEYRFLNSLCHRLKGSNESLLAPKPLGIIRIGDKNGLIMEYLYGNNLDLLIIRSLFSYRPKDIKIFYDLGRVLRKFHETNLSMLRQYSHAKSKSEMRSQVNKLGNLLRTIHFIDDPTYFALKEYIDSLSIDDELFKEVTVHGEFYYTHIKISEEKFAFFDFHRACRGPSYYDLASFVISLYLSTISMPFRLKSFLKIINPFLMGYYGKKYSISVVESFRISTVYVTMLNIFEMLNDLRYSSIFPKMVLVIKLKRLKKLLKCLPSEIEFCNIFRSHYNKRVLSSH
jgi:hypothetical protein